MMRTSSYVFFSKLSDDDAVIVYQGALGYFDRVSRDVADFLRLPSLSDDAVEELQIDGSVLKYLASRGYITSKSPEEELALFTSYAKRAHKQAVDQYAPSFAIVPSYACNLRCFYCFQDHLLHADQRLIDGERINLAFMAIDDLLSTPDFSARREVARVKLYGGEPLLAQNRPAILHIVEKCRERGFLPLRAITNGTELEHYYDLLGPEGIGELQITLDGPRNIHDKRRVGPCYHTTFDLIARNIGLALRRGVHLTLRANVDATNAWSIGELFEYARREGWTDFSGFSFQPATVTPNQRRASHTLITTGQFFSIVQEKSEACGLSCGSPSIVDAAVRQYAKAGRVSLRRTAYCNANLGYYILDLFGDIYSCENEAGTRAKRLGTYLNGRFELRTEAAQRWIDRNVSTIPECSRCPVALICGGGCAYSADLVNGNFYSSYCDGFKEHVAEELPRAYAKHVRGSFESSEALT